MCKVISQFIKIQGFRIFICAFFKKQAKRFDEQGNPIFVKTGQFKTKDIQAFKRVFQYAIENEHELNTMLEKST